MKAEIPKANRAGEPLEDDDFVGGCGYAGHEFGATYPDSICLNGWLWDADSGDADPQGRGWVYTSGGDIPCPNCNPQPDTVSTLPDAAPNSGATQGEGK